MPRGRPRYCFFPMLHQISFAESVAPTRRAPTLDSATHTSPTNPEHPRGGALTGRPRSDRPRSPSALRDALRRIVRAGERRLKNRSPSSRGHFPSVDDPKGVAIRQVASRLASGRGHSRNPPGNSGPSNTYAWFLRTRQLPRADDRKPRARSACCYREESHSCGALIEDSRPNRSAADAYQTEPNYAYLTR